MEYGVRQLIPQLGCASTLRVVVDTSGVHIGAALRMRGVFQRVGHVMDRMYPCRLQVGRGGGGGGVKRAMGLWVYTHHGVGRCLSVCWDCCMNGGQGCWPRVGSRGAENWSG